MKPTASIHYQSYDSRSKKSKAPSNEQNSSSSPTGSTGSKRKYFRCGEPFSRQHMKECRAQNVTCNGCGIKGHLKKCCKKSGNFPKDSNRQNQSPSTGSGKMNFASTLPQTEAEFFDEKGLLKEYRPPVQQQQQQQTSGMFILEKDSNCKLNSKFSFRVSSRSSPRSNPYSRFPIPRIFTHGSSNSISNRFFQHFRYVRSERNQ